MRHLPKHQWVWVSVCAAVSLPFLMRDLGQLGKTPPILTEPLAAPSSTQSSVDAVKIGEKTDLRLEEIRTVVGNAYPGWEPGAKELPESPPTGHYLSPDTLDLKTLPPDEVLYRFSVSWKRDVKETLPPVIRSAPGSGAERYERIQYHGSDQIARRGWSAWQTFKKGTRTADIEIGFAFASETRTLAQFPVPGAFGMSHGAKAAWPAEQNSYFLPVAITLPGSFREQTSGTYRLETYTIDRLGITKPVDTRTIELPPDAKTLNAPLYRSMINGGAQAVRVTITPYHWIRFAKVPLTMPGEQAVRINPVPITAEMEKKRLTVGEGAPPELDEYHEFLRISSKQLTSNPQLAQVVPGAITLTHTPQPLDDFRSSNTGSYFYVFVPDSWESATLSSTLYAIGKSEERVQAVYSGSVKVHNGFRMEFRLFGMIDLRIKEVSFGQTRPSGLAGIRSTTGRN